MVTDAVLKNLKRKALADLAHELTLRRGEKSVAKLAEELEWPVSSTYRALTGTHNMTILTAVELAAGIGCRLEIRAISLTDVVELKPS